MRKIVLVALVALIVAAATAWAESTPAVTTGSATAISNSSAVLHATVNPGGGSTAYNFEYGPTVAYGTVSTTGHVSGTKTVAVTRTPTGLTPGTLYHYRVEASDKAGGALGRDRTFTTTGHPPPGAITGPASTVTTTTVVLTGTVVSQSENTTVYFQYGTTPTYGVQSPPQIVSAALTPSPVSYAITGLAPGTTFHYRLVASHAGAPLPEYGADEAFTTIPLTRFGARVTANVSPSRARHKPYLFATSGTVIPGVALPPGYGCSGLVTVRFSLGRKAVAFRKVAVQSDCGYATTIGFRHLVDHTKTRLLIKVHFLGNSYLRAATARTREVRLG